MPLRGRALVVRCVWIHVHSGGRMPCSLTKYYAMLVAAVASLSAAVVAAYFASIPSLGVAIVAVGAASGLLPFIKDEMNAYARCRGASSTCNMGPNINLLGVAAGILSGISFAL